MNELVSALLSWAVTLSSYPNPEMPPRVEFKAHRFFVEKACKNKECKAFGWYNDEGVVYLDERIRDPQSTEASSIWVHEFVHYLQHRSGKFNSTSCPDQMTREREAYAVQRKFMAAHGDVAYIRVRYNRC